MMSFLRNLVGVKTDQAMKSGLEALVRWDPQAATEAELRTMEQHLDELGQEVARARQSFDNERREADAITQLSHQRMAAAEQLQQQREAATDPQRKAELEKSLATLVGMLEQMQPDMERETHDAKDAEDFLQTLESAYADAGEKLKAARSELDRAHRDMSRAEQQRDIAERQAETARRAAGLASTTSGLRRCRVMRDAAAKDLATAEAARAKAKLLTPSRPEQDDPNIAAALAGASGKILPTADLGSRLTALRIGRS